MAVMLRYGKNASASNAVSWHASADLSVIPPIRVNGPNGLGDFTAGDHKLLNRTNVNRCECVSARDRHLRRARRRRAAAR